MIPIKAHLSWYRLEHSDEDSEFAGLAPELVVETDESDIVFAPVEPSSTYFMATSHGYHDAYLMADKKHVKVVMDVDMNGNGDERKIALEVDRTGTPSEDWWPWSSDDHINAAMRYAQRGQNEAS